MPTILFNRLYDFRVVFIDLLVFSISFVEGIEAVAKVFLIILTCIYTIIKIINEFKKS